MLLGCVSPRRDYFGWALRPLSDCTSLFAPTHSLLDCTCTWPERRSSWLPALPSGLFFTSFFFWLQPSLKLSSRLRKTLLFAPADWLHELIHSSQLGQGRCIVPESFHIWPEVLHDYTRSILRLVVFISWRTQVHTHPIRLLTIITLHLSRRTHAPVHHHIIQTQKSTCHHLGSLNLQITRASSTPPSTCLKPSRHSRGVAFPSGESELGSFLLESFS